MIFRYNFLSVDLTFDLLGTCYFFGQVGGVGGETEIKANLSQSLVEVEAELGNKTK